MHSRMLPNDVSATSHCCSTTADHDRDTLCTKMYIVCRPCVMDGWLPSGMHLPPHSRSTMRSLPVPVLTSLHRKATTHVAPQSTQACMHAVVGKPLVASVVRGRNSTCLMYGQPGSGKTYTMAGAQNSGQAESDGLAVAGDKSGSQSGAQPRRPDDSQGLMPRMLRHLFQVRQSATLVTVHRFYRVGAATPAPFFHE